MFVKLSLVVLLPLVAMLFTVYVRFLTLKKMRSLKKKKRDDDKNISPDNKVELTQQEMCLIDSEESEEKNGIRGF